MERTLEMAASSTEDVMRDLAVRFLINLPDDELSRVERLFMQTEQALWFYEDHYRTLMPHLPKFRSLAAFAEQMFLSCDLLEDEGATYAGLVKEFNRYKFSIPTFGCVLLNAKRTRVALVLNWNKTAWTFPAGKRNEGEDDVDCAIRETWEETGFDASGLVDRGHFLSRDVGGKSKLFIAYGVPEDAEFEPQTSHEIRQVKWFDLERLPTTVHAAPKNMRNVAPLLKRLQRFVKRKIGKKAGGKGQGGSRAAAPEEVYHDASYDNAVTFGAAFGGEASWDVEAMFAQNEKITGRQFVYDGDPSTFGDEDQAAVAKQAKKRSRAKRRASTDQAGADTGAGADASAKGGAAKAGAKGKGKGTTKAKAKAKGGGGGDASPRRPPPLRAFTFDREAIARAMRSAMGT